jgi:hypothetical protein
MRVSCAPHGSCAAAPGVLSSGRMQRKEGHVTGETVAAAAGPTAAPAEMGGTQGARLRLRGHHIVCVFGFRGLGYSDAFVENMKAVVEAFFACDVGVQVGEHCDDICAACPHCVDGECRCREAAEAQVRENDRRVLDALGLKTDEVRPARALARLAAQSIDAAALERLCNRCQWRPLGYCEDGLRRHREAAAAASDRRPTG